MLAARIVKPEAPYTIANIPTPAPSSLRPHDLLLSVSASSLCNTDLQILSNSSFAFTGLLPLTASHEAAGTIVAMGSLAADDAPQSPSSTDNSQTKFRLGDRIVPGFIYARCHACAECLAPAAQNRSQYCTNFKGYCGISRDGAFAEYMICDAREANFIPEEIDFVTAAPLACAGATGWRGVKQAVLGAGLKRGQWLGVVGAGGGVGHLAVMFARRVWGLRVVGLEAREEGIRVAEEAGCEVVLDVRSGAEGCLKEVRRITAGEGVDACVNVSGHEGAAELAFRVTRLHGLVVQVAAPESPILIPWTEFLIRDITLKGSNTASRAEAAEMLQAVREHGIKPITKMFYGLEEVPKLMELAQRGKLGGKGVVVVDAVAKGKSGK
ncbi:MAG: hypothetical protein Q9160_002883 [Pyrenula sp. 1 TL-2023]